jgi:hypothetical protein
MTIIPTQRTERVIEGRDLQIRVGDGVSREELAMKLSGLAHDLLAEVHADQAVEVEPEPEPEPEAAEGCPTCGATGRKPCRDTRPGRKRRAMNKHHADRA